MYLRSATFVPTALLMGALLGACAAKASTPVKVPDGALRDVLERALEKPSGGRITRADLQTLSRLVGARQGIADLTGLEFASSLQSLDLSNNAISDLSPLADLSYLAELRLPSNAISDLSPLSALHRLQKLFLASNAITDLDPLANLSGLVTLDLGSNRISEIRSLSDLALLAELDLSYNEVSDLFPIANLTNMEVLRFDKNAVRDLHPIRNLRKLVSLSFEGNLAEAVEPLSELHALSALVMAANAVRDVSPLVGKDHIWYLDASYNRLKDISHLSRLRGLTRLVLDGNKIEVLPEFDLPELRALSISSNRISDLTPIASLAKLSSLVVADNEISDVSALRSLSRLTYLAADDNRIVDLSPLSELAELDALSLNGNAIADLAPVAAIPGLSSLHLDGNAISDLSPLANLEYLGELWLADNAVSDLSPLSAHRRIGWLLLDGNDVSDLTPLESIQSLHYVSVERNDIVDLSALVSGTALNNGDEVRLAANPLGDVSLANHVRALVDKGVWTNLRTGHVPILVPPGTVERQSLIRIVNDSGTDHLLDVEVRDAEGGNYLAVLPDGSLPTEPDDARLVLGISANGAIQFNSADFVAGNARKGMPRGVGMSPRRGDSWRLAIRGPSNDVEVLSYIRASDGTIAPLSGYVPPEADGHSYRVHTFNPASNVSAESLLRLANAGHARADVVIKAIDDLGELRGTPIRLRLPGLSHFTLPARELESGSSRLMGSTGDGRGKWRLTVTSNRRLEVTNLLKSAQGGYLTNLHSSPVRAEEQRMRNTHFVPLFASSATSGLQAFVRVVNLSVVGGEASILAADDAGRMFGPATLFIRRAEAVQFNSDDLIKGNEGRGLTNGTGAPLAEGSWRLIIESSLDLEVFAFVRASGGFLANHSRATTGRHHRVQFFNPASNARQLSLLRLINWGQSGTKVEIKGVDDLGRIADPVALELGPGRARTLTSLDLEAGAVGLDGMLGDGTGKWRLTVATGEPIDLMSLLSSPSGRMTNLTTASP